MPALYNQIIKNLPELDLEAMKPYFYNLLSVKKEIIDEIRNYQIPPLNIAFEKNDLDEIVNLAQDLKNNFQQIVVLGVGGSSLGGKTLAALANNFSQLMFMESIDANSIANNLRYLDEKIGLKNTAFLVISKSGETIETICQTLIMIEQFKQKALGNIADNFIFITQNHNNSLAKIAKEIGSKIYLHPQNIGGRFSYLSIVGLLPAAIAGLDIYKIRNAAGRVIEGFINEDVEQNHISQIAAHQLYLFDNGFNNNVIMPYIDALKDFTDWYRQLWAESLGKDGFGSTPINSMGTIDQHSQLQLYLDGPQNKFFTFLTNKNPQHNFDISDVPNCPTLFGGKSLNQIVQIEQDSTIEIIDQKEFPIRILELERLDEGVLSALMMQMFLETILVARLKKIDPFDQPAVELRKDLARKYLNN